MQKFTLIENAADSLNHAIIHIDHVQNGNISNWKRVILDLSHVVELLFKERLKRVHPSLMWGNVDKYPSQEAFTVSSEVAFRRLKKIAKISFSKEEDEFIKKLRLKRNQIEHFEFEITDDEARMVIGHILSFILTFAERELELKWQETFIDNDKWKILESYTEFYNNHYDAVDKQIDDNEIPVIVCPSCSHETFGIEEEKCLLCNYAEEVFQCEYCKKDYLCSEVWNEETGLCKSCEDEDSYLSNNFEKY